MARKLLTDEEWKLIDGLFDPPAKTGRPPADRRMIVNGILWILRTGSGWRDMPKEFGPWQTVWRLFDEWNSNGKLDTILRRLQGKFYEAGVMDQELWCIDGTVIRAHRCAAGGSKKATPKRRTIKL